MTENVFNLLSMPPGYDSSTTGLCPYGQAGSTSNTVTPTINTLVYQLVHNNRRATYSTIKFHVTTVGVSSNTLRVGLYNVDPVTNRPSTLILDAGTTSTTGSTGEKTVSISQTVDGPFYIAHVSQTGTSAVCRGYTTPSGVVNSLVYGRSLTVSSTTVYNTLNETSVSGALPSTAGTLSLSTSNTISLVIY